jgi:hypothetical protein
LTVSKRETDQLFSTSRVVVAGQIFHTCPVVSFSPNQKNLQMSLADFFNPGNNPGRPRPSVGRDLITVTFQTGDEMSACGPTSKEPKVYYLPVGRKATVPLGRAKRASNRYCHFDVRSYVATLRLTRRQAASGKPECGLNSGILQQATLPEFCKCGETRPPFGAVLRTGATGEHLK